MFKRIQNIHFVGIGGSGMSGIAEVLITLGYKVSGSDAKVSETTHRLEQLGATVALGHRAENAAGAHVVVTSTAVAADNPEVVEAHKRKIPVIPRIEMLAELARLKYTVAVAGTHGKTTTTSLISLALQSGGFDPTVVVGGRMHNIGTGARVGRGDYLVAEADESDGSFLKLTPTLAVITNIDDDHLDYWGSVDRLTDGFETFANKVPFYGTVFLGIDDAGARRVLPRIRRPVVTYGFAPESDIRADDVRATPMETSFRVSRQGREVGRVTWPVMGRHNTMNALAAVGAGLELGMSFEDIAAALARFEGVGRRLEKKGEAGGVTVVDDYGHHPTEIRATLSALRQRWPERRLVTLFQPHRYSRTQLLGADFAACFDGTDVLGLLDIYAAGETPIPGVTSDALADKLASHGRLATRFTIDKGPDQLRALVRPGDVVLTLGAGDVWKWGENLLKQLA